jgi:nucleoside-diphosphate-sugar epimerase
MTLNNLLIGNTSQLSHYFPDENYIKISSRNIDYEHLTKFNWDRVFICIGESRKFISNTNIYDDVNFYLTLDIIDKLKDISKSIVIYSSCELWNKYDGQIDISMNFDFYNTSYLQSKYRMSKYILSNIEKYYNIFILYPFNFNSTYRDNNFLFGKIFDSIINKKRIEIGDTYFYRDIIHPKYVVEESIKASGHKIVGSGRTIFVNDFIREIYSNYNMNYDEYVIENINKFNEYEKRNEYYLKSNKCLYSYKNLLKDTISDIDKLIR